jgi:hypothetical protein
MAKVRVNWGQADEHCSVRVFAVHNTAHNCLYVLAPDPKTAMSIAYTANHVYDPTPKIALGYSRSVYEVTSPYKGELQANWDMIQQATNRRLQGTLHFEDGGVCVGDEFVGK